MIKIFNASSSPGVKVHSTCPPSLSTQVCALDLMALTARRIIPLSCRRASTASTILALRSPRSRGGVTKIFPLRKPEGKSTGGEVGTSQRARGHSMGWFIWRQPYLGTADAVSPSRSVGDGREHHPESTKGNERLCLYLVDTPSRRATTSSSIRCR